ncbi:MAG TPA: VWA domain-containing protein [Bacteroidales bacterium]|jgi:nitric oxide reductase NorD protein|nr:VWA domain-containing protein [Bacteroidia bacterium]HMM12173.1 VWA domain-containing protein [Bacteroidales bacterium]
MALDEFLFAKAIKALRAVRRPDAALQGRRVELEALKHRLTILARAFTAQPVELFPAEREGGSKGLSWFLPSQFDLFPNRLLNEKFYLFRVLYLSGQYKLGLNWSSQTDHSVELSQRKAYETHQAVLNYLIGDYPQIAILHHELTEALQLCALKGRTPDVSWLYGRWMSVNDNNLNNPSINFAEDSRCGNAPNDAQTVVKAKAVEEIKLARIDKKQQEDYVLTHNFEKVETAEEFQGVWRDFDGSDQLSEHHDALDELNMRWVVRTNDPTHSIYQAEFTENTLVAESETAPALKSCYVYDEWDYKKKEYHKDFCRIYERRPEKYNNGFRNRVIEENVQVLETMRKMIANVNNRRCQVRKQSSGENFDLDAVIDGYADLVAGKTPSEKLYLSDRKIDKELSIMLLLDNSLSTDSYAAGNKVIEVEKQVATLFGEILNENNIDFAIAGFGSQTRNHSNFTLLKGFDEKWSSTAGYTGSLSPEGYTRIGVALRHAGAKLLQRQAKNKWLILLSDGKPNDYDRYEGRYGIADVKQALKELHQQQINVFAFAIEAQARYYLPQMFGASHFQILTKPSEMMAALVKLYAKIKQL